MADELGAEDVARKVFGTSFRGYEQGEVRAFLGRVAAELAAVEARARDLEERLAAAEARAVPRQIDEDELEVALGAEATKVLHAARSAAAEIRANAEADAARLTDEAAAVLDDTRHAAARDADATREEAQHAAAAAVAAAEAEGRGVVAEAHAERDRILRDLARRQRTGHQQLARLRAARDALLEAFGGVQAVVDAAAAQLVGADGDGRAAAEAAGLRLPTADAAAAAPTEAEAVAATVASGAPVPRGASPGPAVAEDAATTPAVPSVERVVEADGPHATSVHEAGSPADDARRKPVGDDREPVIGARLRATGAASRSSSRADGPPSQGQLPALDRLDVSRPASVVASGAGDATGGVTSGAEGSAPGADDEGVAVPGVGSTAADEEDPLAVPAAGMTTPRASVEASAEAMPSGGVATGGEGAGAKGSQPLAAHAAGEATATHRPSPVGTEPERRPDVTGTSDSPDALVGPARPGAIAPPVMAAERPGHAEGRRGGADGGETTAADDRPRRPDDQSPAGEVTATGRSIMRVPSSDGAGGRTPGAPDAVDALLARLRADRAAALERAAEVLTDLSTGQRSPAPEAGAGAAAEVAGHVGATGAAAGEDVPSVSGPDAVTAAFARRDREVAEHGRVLTRALKRALADEQNRLLDALRRHRGVPRMEELLPPAVDHERQYASVAEPIVVAVAAAAAASAATSGPVAPATARDPGAGRARGRLGAPPPPASGGAGAVGTAWDGPLVDVRDIAAALGREVVTGLRPRVERALEEWAGDDDGRAGEVLSAGYREWKSSRAEPAAHGAVLAAWGAGAFLTAPEGTLVWLVDPSSSCSPDCADNALAGPTPKGEPFPTGHRHPPAHPGCRCLVVTATR